MDRKNKIIVSVVTSIIVIVLAFIFVIPKSVVMYDKEFKNTDTYIDLSDTDYSNISELENNLSKFKRLRVVHFGEKRVLDSDKIKLMSKYPNIEFECDTYHNIYGMQIDSDTTNIDLTNVKVDNDLENKLVLLTNLKEVNFYNNSLSNDEKLALSEKFPDVTFMWKVKVLSDEVDSNVETLDLSKKKVDNIEELKKSLKLLKNLKTLDMSDTNLSNEELGNLRNEFENIRIDWKIYLNGGRWTLRTDAVAFSVLIYTFDYKKMTSEDIADIKYCDKLQALDLGHQAITDVSIIGEYLPNLRILILADNKISDITPLSKLRYLHYVELFMNNLTDISPLAECKELVDVNLCYNTKIATYKPILELPLLERLWIVGNHASQSEVNEIKTKFPKATICNYGAGSTNSGWREHERYFAMLDMFHKDYISELFSKYDGEFGEKN